MYFKMFVSCQSAAEEGKKGLVQDKEKSETHFEMQLAALNENLSTIRLDMATAQNRLTETERINEELRGEKLGESIMKMKIKPFLYEYVLY